MDDPNSLPIAIREGNTITFPFEKPNAGILRALAHRPPPIGWDAADDKGPLMRAMNDDDYYEGLMFPIDLDLWVLRMILFFIGDYVTEGYFSFFLVCHPFYVIGCVDSHFPAYSSGSPPDESYYVFCIFYVVPQHSMIFYATHYELYSWVVYKQVSSQ
jgi:hypothetical protein